MSESYIYHHGIKGQKWGVRRFQNQDGTLTSIGRSRYSSKKSADEADQTKKTMLTDKQKKRLKKLVISGAVIAGMFGYKKLKDIGVIDSAREKMDIASEKISKSAKRMNEVRKRVSRALKNTKPVDWNEINRMTMEVNRPNGGKIPVTYDKLRLAEMSYDIERASDHKKWSAARAMKPSDLARESSEYAALFDKSFSRKRGYR